MAKGEKVNTEQFYEINRRFDDLSNKMGNLEKDVNNRFSTLEKEVGYKTDMLKWGIIGLIGLGLFKSCGEGNIKEKTQYTQNPTPQIYIITPQDNESYKKQLESLQEKLKSFEGKNESYKGDKK